MSPRELVILIIGLAIVGVVLRGLYVALQARRGQIRLAIDKNIPKDIDLDALEMAELPSGGARVVERSLAEVNRQNQAVKKAQAMNLADRTTKSDPIPVLMDPVELQSHYVPEQSDPVLETTADAVSSTAAAPQVEAYVDAPNTVSVHADLDEELAQQSVEDYDHRTNYESDAYDDTVTTDDLPVDEDTDENDDPDSVLFDYGDPVAKVDNLSQVTPDYPDGDDYDDDYDDYDDDDYGSEDEDDLDEEDFSDEDFDEDDEDEDLDDEEYIDDDDEELDDDDLDDEDLDDDESFDDYDPLDDDDLIDDDDDEDLNFVDDDLDDFSMTAGERIGYAAARKPVLQPELFTDDEAPRPAVSKPKSKRKPLFAALGRKLLQKTQPDNDTAARQQPEPTQRTRQMPQSTVAAEKTRPVEPVKKPAAEPAVVVVAKPKAQEVAATPSQSRVASLSDTKSGQPVRAEASTGSSAAEPSEVVVINVMAKQGRVLNGDDLLHVLITSGMKFGEMNIFHRRLGGDNKGPIIFSIANILNPGTFDLNKMHEFTTRGVSLFLALPTSINNLEALNQMLTVANQICDAFDAELRDDNRNLMTAQTIEHYRQRIRDFELRRLKAVGARG